MDDLTPRQRQVLQFIQDALVEHGMPPTRAEIAQLFLTNAVAPIRLAQRLSGGVEGPLEKEIAPDGSQQSYLRLWWPDPTILLEPA